VGLCWLCWEEKNPSQHQHRLNILLLLAVAVAEEMTEQVAVREDF
jgi:hypothetical protein